MKLNLGCGKDIREGWVNLDSVPGPGVDEWWDLDTGKLPFKDNTAEYILASHILEHILHWEKIVIECHRVLRSGGTLEIRVPYGFKGADHPYHLRFFTKKTLNKLCYMNEHDSSLQMLASDRRFIMESVKVDHQWKEVPWFVREALKGKGSWKDVFLDRKQIIWRLKKP